MLSKILYIVIFQFVLILTSIKLSKIFDLVDYPQKRKIHTNPTPYTGGVTLALGYIFIVIITNFENNHINIILNYSLLVALGGLIDDKYQVNPGTKIILQIVPIFLLIDVGLILNDLGDYNLFNKLELGSFAKIFTILSCLLLINAFNYSDGLDGLLACISISILGSFYFYIKIYSNLVDADFIIYIAIPITIFLIFNLGLIKNNKIFLGDSGSNLLGFIFSFITIFLYHEYDIHPALLIWPLAYIVYEFLSVNLNRILFKKKIFKAGSDHLHYELMSFLNTSQIKVMIAILILNLLLSFLGYNIYRFFGPDLSLISFIITFFVFFIFKIYINKKINKN